MFQFMSFGDMMGCRDWTTAGVAAAKSGNCRRFALQLGGASA